MMFSQAAKPALRLTLNGYRNKHCHGWVKPGQAEEKLFAAWACGFDESERDDYVWRS